MSPTSDARSDPALSVSPADQPSYLPFPELAHALRSQSTQILAEWRGKTLLSMPELGTLSVKEFEDDIARILSAMADALESNDPPELRRLVDIAPSHGFQRFMQEYDLADLFEEERVLRRVIVSKVEEALTRQCASDEAAALHTMIDIMLQQGVLALVQQQKHELRQASEAQLTFLSFLNHDLSNNFLVITLNLEFLEQRLAKLPEMRESAEVIDASLETLRRTRKGMLRLLEHEQLRRTETPPDDSSPVNLREVVEPILLLAASEAHRKNQRVHIGIDPNAMANTNADLLTIILQNLVGNAIKHAARAMEAGTGGTVRIDAERQHEHGKHSWRVSVADDGPGIPADQLERLFNAFKQLPRAGEKAFESERGFGLGLAIASQAARLLGTTIEVKTKVGRGSKFSFLLPECEP